MARGQPVKAAALVLVVAASVAFADGERLAVHPLAIEGMPPAQCETIQAGFDVMLARVKNIRLAGSGTVDEALAKRAGQDCQTRDACLRFLAEATESQHALHVQLQAGRELVAQARVVRADGTQVRQVALAEPLGKGIEPAGAARRLLGRVLDALALETLGGAPALGLGLVPVAWPGVAPAVARAPEAPALRRPIGFALLGVGAVAFATGLVAAGLAVDGHAHLTFDAKGAVPRSQAARAADVGRTTQAAAVMIPVGALVAIGGGLLAFWPSPPPVAVDLTAGRDRLGFSIAGAFP